MRFFSGVYSLCSLSRLLCMKEDVVRRLISFQVLHRNDMRDLAKDRRLWSDGHFIVGRGFLGRHRLVRRYGFIIERQCSFIVGGMAGRYYPR